MTIICKNCHNHYKGQFCNKCGQSADTKEINFHFLWHDIQHGLFHFDNGILYTIKSLFLKPGNTIRDFINGKRIKHFKPISFVIFLATFYGFLKYYIDIPSILVFSLDSEEEKIFGLKNITNWLSSHYAASTLILLVITSFSTFLAFKKQKYNFLQHFVLNSYLTGITLVINIAFVPFLYLVEKSNWLLISFFSSRIGTVYYLWALFQIFNTLPIKIRLWRMILSYLILGLIYFGLAFISATMIGIIVENAKH